MNMAHEADQPSGPHAAHYVFASELSRERIELQTLTTATRKYLRALAIGGRRPLVIWGAGGGGQRIRALLPFPILAIVDSNPAKTGTTLNDSPVVSPSSLDDAHLRDAFIVVASVYAREIAGQLTVMGKVWNADFVALNADELAVLDAAYSDSSERANTTGHGARRTMPVRDPLVAQECTKYERMWGFGEYRGNRDNVPQADRFIELTGMQPGATVLDFGCGPGYATRRFVERRMRGIGIDIAHNALDSENDGVFEFVCGSIWTLEGVVSGDYGFCTDAMEHIPPGKVDATLTAIRRMVREDVYFEISLRPDSCGRLIGDVLHLTVKPLDWWRERLGRYWRFVEIVAMDEVDKSAAFLASHMPRLPVPVASARADGMPIPSSGPSSPPPQT